MATRMKVLGIKAAVVGGRVRDLRELQATELPVGDFILYTRILKL
jgi:regulator of RNase E activity RraA